MFISQQACDFLKENSPFEPASTCPKKILELAGALSKVPNVHFANSGFDTYKELNRVNCYIALLVTKKGSDFIELLHNELLDLASDPNNLKITIRYTQALFQKDDKVLYNQPTSVFFFEYEINGSDSIIQGKIDKYLCDFNKATSLASSNLDGSNSVNCILDKMKGN